jgi:CspA family cold shock protein
VREVQCALDLGQNVMGKYRDHRERRGKHRGNDQEAFFEPASPPSYFQDAPSTVLDTVDAELLWFHAARVSGS